MTPGVAANVREVISSSLRSWIIESLEHFGVDSLVFLHVIQSILEQDVRSLRGEDALDDLWKGRLTSIGSKRGGGGGRDPKRQMNEDDLRRCVLLENMRACFKEDESDAAEEFVDELLHRWTEETQRNVEANGGGVKKSGQDLREEMDDEDNRETKDPVREYNEAFPALGSSTRVSPADQTETETLRRQNRNCAELLKEFLKASSLNPETDCSREESMRGVGSTQRAKCCKEVAQSMARDFVNSSAAGASAYTQQNYSARLRSNKLIGSSDLAPDLSRKFSANKPRTAADVSSGNDYTPGGIDFELNAEDAGGRLPMPSLQGCSAEMSNDDRRSRGEGGRVFPPLLPEVLSRTVEMILAQGHMGVPCRHVHHGSLNDAGASPQCIQCRRKQNFPIYTENEFGMLIRLDEECGPVVDERSDRRGYGTTGVSDTSQRVRVGKDAFSVALDARSTGGAMEKIAEEEVDLDLLGPILTGSSEMRRGSRPDQPRDATSSGLNEGRSDFFDSAHQTERQRNETIGRCVLRSGYLSPTLGREQFYRLNDDLETRDDQGLTGRNGLLRAPTVRHTTAAQQIKPSQANDSQRIGETDGLTCLTASADNYSQWVNTNLADALTIGRTRDQSDDVTSGNVVPTSPASVSCRLGRSDCALATTTRGGVRDVDSTSAASCELVLRLLADVIERDLMNQIAASLIPLFPDLSAPQTLFLPDAEILAHIAVQNCIPRDPNQSVGSDASRAGTCENDYMLYLHLAIRQEDLGVDHVLNFEDFCRWRWCLLEQANSAKSSMSCTCDLCHRALERLADSRYAFVDVGAAALEAGGTTGSSELAVVRETVATSGHQELQSEKQGSHFSSEPALVMNACLQNSSAGTGDFTGRFDGISTNKVPSGKEDGNYGCRSFGEGDVLQRSYCPADNVFGRSSLREIWPDGDADRKSEERWSGFKEHLEENNNVLESFAWTPENGFPWPSSSQGVSVGNSVNIWLNSGSSLASTTTTASKKAALGSKSCDKTVLPDLASDETGEYGSAGYAAVDFSASAANVCDKVTSADTIRNKPPAAVCRIPSLPGVCDQSALIARSCDESDGSCHHWFNADIAETVVAAFSSIVPSESKLKCLSPSMQTLERLLSSDEERSSSAESFRSALHEDFYSLWLNTSGSTHGHESSSQCAEETSLDRGSQSLSSDDDASHNSEAHYEADVSSSDSSLDGDSLADGISDARSAEAVKRSAAKRRMPSDGDNLFGLSFSMPSEPCSSFSPVGIDDIVSRKHSRFQSSQSSVDSSEATDDASESDMSKPYSAAGYGSTERLSVADDECKGLLSDLDPGQPHVESYDEEEEEAADRFQTDSEDLEEPTLYRNLEECGSENVVSIVPVWDVNLPDAGNLTGLTSFSCGQQEVDDLEKFEKLKSIWDEMRSDDFIDSTGDRVPKKLGSVDFKEGRLSESFGQLNVRDVQRQLLPSRDLEGSENYRNVSVLWDADQVKAQTAFGGIGGLESSRGLAPNWNQQTPGLECGMGGMRIANWRGNEENPRKDLLTFDWNEQEDPRTDAGMPSWNTLHQPGAESCTDLISHRGQQRSGVENLEEPTLHLENFKESTDNFQTVEVENFEELESIWVGKKSSKGMNRQVNEIQGDNSAAFVSDSNQEDSDSANLKNLASLKSIWEGNELCVESSNGLKKADWDFNDVADDCAVDLAASTCGHRAADLVSCKDLSKLKCIWDEKEPCSTSSMGVQQQNWERNQMGTDLSNLKEMQRTWEGNRIEVENLLEAHLNCDQEEAALRNVENLIELRFIWDDAASKSEITKDVTPCSRPESTLDRLMPISDNTVDNFLDLGAGSVDRRAANLAISADVRLLWEDERRRDERNPNGPPTINRDDHQELTREDVTRHEGSSLHATSDLDKCMLLTAIWERKRSDGERPTSCWDVGQLEGNASESTSNTNHGVAAECAEYEVRHFPNQAESLRMAKRKNLESLIGAIWDMNSNDGETGVGFTYDSDQQENDAEASFQNLDQLESLWGERESNVEDLRGWEVEPSEANNLIRQAPIQEEEEDAGQDSFQNLKSIWDEKPPEVESVKGLMIDWDVVNQTDAEYVASDQDHLEADPGDFQNLKSIWEEKESDLDASSKGASLQWDRNGMDGAAAVVLPMCPDQQETDPRSFLNLSEVKSIWVGSQQSSSENLDTMGSCWDNQAPDLENMAWDATGRQPPSENLLMLNAGQQDNDCRNLKSIWEGQQRDEGNLKGCWKQQGGDKPVILNAGTSDWNVAHRNSESFDNSLFDLSCQKSESENFDDVMSSLGDIKQSNSEIFLDRRLTDPGYFRRPTSDRELHYGEEIGELTSTSNVDLWQSDSGELKQMISRWDKQQTECRRIRGVLSHLHSQQTNLAAEWQLADAANRLEVSSSTDDAAGLWRLAGRSEDNVVLTKLVPSENSAFQDEIPRRFVYRYAFFDPRDVRGCDLLATKDARTETIRHIYEPSNSIVRQLEDLFDDGQRLHAEESLANRPNCLFRPIGEQNSGRDSRQSVAASAGFAADVVGDLTLQIKSPSSDPSDVVEPNSPYQLYLGVESQAFVPRFRVHKELEKSAQTGEATPPMQNDECVFGMNVILSTIALLE